MKPHVPVLHPSHLPQFCSLLVVPKSRTWATTRNDLQDAKQSEVPAGNTVTRRASGVVGGSALQRSMAVGAQPGRTSPRGVCVVIIMTSCVGAVGSDERAHACSASRRFMSRSLSACVLVQY